MLFRYNQSTFTDEHNFVSLSFPTRWMNKMGLAAIVFDTSNLDTTAGFVRRGVSSTQNAPGEMSFNIVLPLSFKQ